MTVTYDLTSSLGPIRQTRTFAWRSIRKIRQTPEQLLDILVMPVLFTVMFTYLFGGALAGTPREYLQYLLPGILAQTMMFTSIYTGVTLKTDVPTASTIAFARFQSGASLQSPAQCSGIF